MVPCQIAEEIPQGLSLFLVCMVTHITLIYTIIAQDIFSATAVGKGRLPQFIVADTTFVDIQASYLLQTTSGNLKNI
jgi:hypothetical protein